MKPPHKKAKKEKEFRKILKRQQELYKQRHELGYIKLKEPIRHGWFKVMELTPFVEQYKNADAIKEVFDKITTSYWGATKEKAEQYWDKERTRYMLVKDKPTISKRSFRKLSEKAKELCVFFRYKNEYTGQRGGRFYVNLPKGSFEVRFRRSYITHRKIIDPAIESEIAQLDNVLLQPGLYELNKRGYWFRWSRMDRSFERKAETHRVKERLMSYRNTIISEGLKEKIVWELN